MTDRSNRSVVTVGVDIGTTSVKAVAADGEGRVVAKVRVPHRIVTPEPDRLEHVAEQAWRQGPRRALRRITESLSESGMSIAGVAVASMVPSLTAVDEKGRAILPGLLYGDSRSNWDGRDEDKASIATGAVGGPEPGAGMPDATGFLRWAVDRAPHAAGYWPCQSLATHAMTGVAALDSAAAMVFGDLCTHRGWDEHGLAALGARTDQMPRVVPMGGAACHLRGTTIAVAGGTIDALCDQLVSGATEPGDVLAIFGATLVVWVVTDQWVEVPGLITVPHTQPGRVLIGGPSNAGALFADWARQLLRGVRPPGAVARRGTPAVDGQRRREQAHRGDRSRLGLPTDESDGRTGDATRVPIWLPYVRGERTPLNDPMLRASIHGMDLTQGPAAIERAVYEASGFVIRRILDRSGIQGRRVVASGGGSKAQAWMAAVADATELPVDAVAVAEGAAYGASFLARVAAGLEPSIDESQRWSEIGRRILPETRWSAAAGARYKMFTELGPGT
ncbi:MAG: FGGY-family carbohydrate kinase [Actinomycetota bacterium]|jgi:xylulokinase|nr:FGGY-family carbohydrate kinase [Actinomycetota bacterium]